MPSITFASKAGAYPTNIIPSLGKNLQEQTHQLILPWRQ